MTNREAIKTLHELWRTTNDPWYEKVYEMAINALKAQEQLAKNSPKVDSDFGDLISRKAAIRVASGYCHPANIVKELEKLPPAQPEIRTQMSSANLISRQAAIRKLKKMATQAYIDKLNGSAETVINCCIDVIERQIPSAQPERKTGRWEIYVISMLDGDGCKCSECGFEGVPYWDFCPNCGARMEGES